MLHEYLDEALNLACYKILDDGTWFAEIPGFDGVWANAGTVEACRRELLDVVEEWILIKVRAGDPLPVLPNHAITLGAAAVA